MYLVYNNKYGSLRLRLVCVFNVVPNVGHELLSLVFDSKSTVNRETKSKFESLKDMPGW